MIRSRRHSIRAPLLLVIFAVTTNAQQSNQQLPNGSSPSATDLNSQGIQVAVIHGDSFYEPNNGIGRLVNAIRILDQEFQSRKAELRSMQQRIEQLSNETERTAPVLLPRRLV